jgi:hypothetical protein
VEEIGRRLVHPVDVFEHEHRWGREDASQELDDGLLDLRPTKLFGKLLDLGGGRERDVERDGDERQPGNQIWRVLLDARPQLTGRRFGPGIEGDSEHRSERSPEGVVGGGRRIELAGRRQHGALACALSYLGEQTCLPDSGWPDHFEEPALIPPDAV